MRIEYPAWIMFCVLTLVGAGADAHLDNPHLTDKCGSCHVGHGEPGQPMLEAAEEDFCFQCHGAEEERSRMVAAGRLLPGAYLVDLRQEFDKMSAHPIENRGVHSPVEQLPSHKSSVPNHAECVDCHNPHERSVGEKVMNFEVSGYSLAGQHLERSTFEYEICLKCHADHLTGKSGAQGIMQVFATSVRSQHPVTLPSDGRRLPSMRDPAPAGFRMKCSDCHRSDNPSAPRGPHGSNHEFLLSGYYDRGTETTESSHAFEFCYSCHDRQSLLGNESFPYHREHIEGDPFTGRPGTSCFTCHASHGSPRYPHLIEFNGAAVYPTDSGRPVEYQEYGAGGGTCVLKCHGYNHDPGSY